MIYAAIFACGLVAYPATVERVIDGDSVELTINLGLDVAVRDNSRLWGINAPERWQDGGSEATEHLKGLLPSEVWASLQEDGRDKYGRPLVRLFDKQCKDINQAMVDDGHAREYLR